MNIGDDANRLAAEARAACSSTAGSSAPVEVVTAALESSSADS